jgi:hypothetical protein
MNTTELNTVDDIRMISDEDLGAVAGGFQTYGGGGGKVLPGGFRQGNVAVELADYAVIALFFCPF